MNNYVIGIDQSTQGTKAILVDSEGRILARTDRSHRQIVSPEGYVSHDLEEIYKNTLAAVRELLLNNRVSEEAITAVGISNQRETTTAFRPDGSPIGNAIVWQCARATEIVNRMTAEDPAFAEFVYDRTGLPLSPYFSAAKMRWLLENQIGSEEDYRFGTIDTYLVYRLTEGAVYRTDYSNASRTQLLNLHTLSWDDELLSRFGIKREALPEIGMSDGGFGETTFGGFLKKPVPILSVMGDSHAALFAQGCHQKGMVKTTYGTGSSIMMNIGPKYQKSAYGLATSLAWGREGEVDYVLEGNINYAAAVITWLKNDLHLIESAREVEAAAFAANPEDRCVLVPAFTGLSAPHWDNDARAIITGMSRTTGRNEIIRAAEESIGFQITDVLLAMEKDSGIKIEELRVDGGPTRDKYLMQFQSDLADAKVCVPNAEEFSALGVSYMAGIRAGMMRDTVFSGTKRTVYEPKMSDEKRAEKFALWNQALQKARS